MVIALVFVLRFEVPRVRTFAFMLSGLAFTLFIASTVVARPTAWLSRALDKPVWFQLGLMSYGVYLWHEPLMLELSQRGWLVKPQPEAFWTNALMLIGVSLLVAGMTYWAVERPAQEARDLLTPDGQLHDDYITEREQNRRHQREERTRDTY